MAFMSQEHKKSLAPAIMAVCKRYGVKATISVDHHTSLVLTIKSAPFDLIANRNKIVTEYAERRGDPVYLAKDYFQVNTHHIDSGFSGKSRRFLNRVLAAMNEGNWDKSETQTDYFNVGWYVDVNIGRWNKPFVVKA